MSDSPRPPRSEWYGPPSVADHRLSLPAIQPGPNDPPPLEYATSQPVSLKYRIGWFFAALAMAAGVIAWPFDVAWLTTGSARAGILGFLAALASGVCVFIGELIVAPGPKPSWFRWAAILSLGSILFVAFATVLKR